MGKRDDNQPITPWQGSWAQRMQAKDWPLGTPPKAAEPPKKS